MKLTFLAFALACSSCSSIAPFVATGDSLVILGNEFADAGSAMNQALDKGLVTPEQYRGWAAFASRFQVFYPLAVKAWRTALELNDKALAGQFGQAAAQLAAELADFWAQLEHLGMLPAVPR